MTKELMDLERMAYIAKMKAETANLEAYTRKIHAEAHEIEIRNAKNDKK
jgi:hypothetical protein